MAERKRRRLEEWIYLLCGIGYPSTSYPLRDHIATQLAALPSLGIALRPVLIRFPGDPRGKDQLPGVNRHFAFSIRGGEADDDFAQRLSEATLATLTLWYGPMIDETPLALRMPASLLLSDVLSFRKLIASDARVPYLPQWELQMRLRKCLYVPDTVLVEVWRLLPVAIEEPYFPATHYYMASVLQYSFEGDAIAEVLADDPDAPVLQTDVVRAESAVHNAFKAIETLVGEPPRHEGKFRHKLRELGVHPDELIGFHWFGRGPPREPVAAKIRAMHKLRDERSAHAKTGKKPPVTYYEIMDTQGTCRFVLLTAMNFKLTQSASSVKATS